MQSMLHTYNVSNQLASSIKGTFIESPNARKIMQVSMVNPFWPNGMETKAFYQLHYLHSSNYVFGLHLICKCSDPGHHAYKSDTNLIDA